MADVGERRAALLFRSHAKECRERAGQAATDEERAILEEIARLWESLANEYDRLTPPES